MLIWTVTVSPREISTLATLFLYTRGDGNNDAEIWFEQK